MHTVASYDTVWSIEHADPNVRYAMKSQPVSVNSPVIIEHCATSHFLASDLVEYRNDFGTEYEVCVHSFATLNKSQSLALERSGKLTRELPTKFQNEQNIWTFITSNDPATDFPFDRPTAESVAITTQGKLSEGGAQTLFAAIRAKLLERGSYGIRGLGQVFKHMDKNGNHKLDPDEFQAATQNYGLTLSPEAPSALHPRIGNQSPNVGVRQGQGWTCGLRGVLAVLASECVGVSRTGGFERGAEEVRGAGIQEAGQERRWEGHIGGHSGTLRRDQTPLGPFGQKESGRRIQRVPKPLGHPGG
jgi:hypothetical protein